MYTLREITEKFKTNNKFTGTVLENEPVAPRTTFKIGGAAPLLLEPETQDSLAYALSELHGLQVPVFVLGGGSNIVVSDNGFDGAVVATCRLDSISAETKAGAPAAVPADLMQGQQVTVTCGAGVTMQQFVYFCIKHGLSGAENFAGLPGSVGGAAYMNARCFDTSVSDIIGAVTFMHKDGSGCCTKVFAESDWGYKKSPFTGTDLVIASVQFNVTACGSGGQQALEEKCAAAVAARGARGHFKYPSAGSVFKNNHDFGAPTGKIIDDAGLKGFAVGGARIAPWHGNIIINEHNATQADVRALTDYVMQKIKEKTGFNLELEIIFCGK